MLFGLILLVVYFIIANLSIAQAILLLMLLIPSTLILTNFALITSCIGFFIPDADELSKNAFEIMFGPSLYPSGVYQGAMRIFFLFILPTMAIAGLPVEAVKDLNLNQIFYVWALAIIWTLIALFVLKQGIKKYESGNLTGARI
jgi:ABC-2 type transport system permease protein